MASKNLSVKISTKTLEFVKANKYNLCIARMVNNAYTVVWRGVGNVMENNEFTWTPVYKVFGQNSFVSGMHVATSADAVPIAGNETTVLDSAGVFLPATGTSDASKPFHIENKFGPIHPAVLSVEGGSSSVIYVAPLAAMPGIIDLTPIEKVRVWFDQKLTTGTMISEARGATIDVDFTSSNSHTIQFTDDMKWQALTFSPNDVLIVPTGKLESAAMVAGNVSYKVLFAISVQTALQGIVIAKMTTTLRQMGVSPSELKWEGIGSSLTISFAKQDVVNSVVGKCEVPDYRGDIEKALESAAKSGDLPRGESWTITGSGKKFQRVSPIQRRIRTFTDNSCEE